MICAECAWEADYVKFGRLGKHPARTVSIAPRRVVAPNYGHNACTGCDCHHEPVQGADD